MPRGDNNKGNPRAHTPVCSGHTTKGVPCRNPAMHNGKCYKHGGNSRKGIASGTFKTGRYSKDLLGHLSESYHEELRDGDLVALIEEIALARAYLRDILKSGESSTAWSDAAAAVRELDDAIVEGRSDDLMPALRRLRGVMRSGRNDWRHRDEMMSRLEGIRKLVDSEHKHRIDNRLAVTHEQMVATLTAVVHIVSRHVGKDQLYAIDNEIGALIRASGGGVPRDPSPN